MSTGKHFHSKHKTTTMLAFFIKIETSHGFVVVLKAETSLKRFSQFYAIYFSCVVYPVPEFGYFVHL